ncbi:hypothetical protein GCM10023224_04950 [Streptomonospora halophila]|uniref:Uncharacterized protein n=1 Tax=Streptomonospora halophila TaxID=427369 RepID=A0ABP9G574_9ACTN
MHLGLPELLALVGTAGIGGTLLAIAKAWAAHRDGARARERDVIKDSEDWRRHADDARRDAEARAAWWRDRAAELWLQCVQHGGQPGPLGRPPRSESDFST